MPENNNIPTGLYWQGKMTEVERISLSFQPIETINRSRVTRDKEKDTFFHSKNIQTLVIPEFERRWSKKAQKLFCLKLLYVLRQKLYQETLIDKISLRFLGTNCV